MGTNRAETESKNMLTRLEKEVLKELSKSGKIFNYKSFTIENIAEKFNTSTSTVHRLSKKLGYKSFIQFKDAYFNDTIESLEVKESFDKNYLNVVTRSCNYIGQADLDKIVDMIYNSKRVIIYGMGINRYLGKIFKTELQILDILTEQYDDPQFVKLSSKGLKRGEDLVFIFSKSGENRELLEVLVETNLKGVESVLITEAKDSTFETLSEYTVYTGNMNEEKSILDTRISSHIAIDLILKRFNEKYKTSEKIS